MKEYCFISDSVGVIPRQKGFNWIYWALGQKTREGWEEYPEGVSANLEGMPIHYLRNGEDIARDLQEVWLPNFIERLRLREQQESQGVVSWESTKL